VLACQKDASNEKEKNISNDVNDAKEWWYGVFRKSPDYSDFNWDSPLAPTVGNSTKKYPDWKYAIAYRKYNNDIVELPLFYITNNVLLPGMKDLYSTPEGDRIARSVIHKLVITKKNTGKVYVRTVSIIPSADYAKRRNYDISNLHLNQLPIDFDGYLSIAGWDLSLINMIRVEKGKMVKKINIATNKEMQKKIKKHNFASRLICPEPVWVPNYQWVCVVVPTGDAVADHETCEENGHEVENGGDYEYPDCYDDGEGETLDDCLQGSNPENCDCIVYNIGCGDGGGGGDNEPPPIFMNDCTDPCLHSSVDYATSRDCQNKVSTFLNNVFGISDHFDYQWSNAAFGGTNSSIDALTGLTPSISDPHGLKINTSFNTSQLGDASKEYIAATILHEAVHGWIDFTFPLFTVSNTQHHELMASADRFNMMKNALKEMFPNLPEQDAIDLTWGGLYNTILFNNLPSTEKARIIQENENYKHKSSPNGKGTPC